MGHDVMKLSGDPRPLPVDRGPFLGRLLRRQPVPLLRARLHGPGQRPHRHEDGGSADLVSEDDGFAADERIALHADEHHRQSDPRSTPIGVSADSVGSDEQGDELSGGAEHVAAPDRLDRQRDAGDGGACQRGDPPEPHREGHGRERDVVQADGPIGELGLRQLPLVPDRHRDGEDTVQDHRSSKPNPHPASVGVPVSAVLAPRVVLPPT